jgi:hypothetical protein
MIGSYIVFPAILICAIAIIAEGFRSTRKKANGMPLPPGPRLLPFVGNMFDIDVARPWLTYAKWGKQYGRLTCLSCFTANFRVPGDVVYARILGQHFVLINSEKVGRAIVNKRSAIYSDRPSVATSEEYV